MDIPHFSLKIQPLFQSNVASSFPLFQESTQRFSTLRSYLASACGTCIQEGVPIVLKCDASELALTATLNPGGQPVAFHS